MLTAALLILTASSPSPDSAGRALRYRVDIPAPIQAVWSAWTDAAQTGWGRGGEWDESYRYFTSAWKFVLTMLHYRYTVGPVDWSSFPGKDVLAEHERGVTIW